MDLERWRLLTEFLALSGLRIGEAAALETTDIEGDYISVTKSYSESFHNLGPTKTRGSNREVFIQPELADVIKKVRICMVKQRMLYGYEDPGHLFVSQEGNRIGYASYNKYLKGIAEKTVPGKTVTPHTLRHTMTSLFAEAGVPLEAISRRLGHESSALTREIYLHITKETKVKDNAEISSVHLLA
jgi:integrase